MALDSICQYAKGPSDEYDFLHARGLTVSGVLSNMEFRFVHINKKRLLRNIAFTVLKAIPPTSTPTGRCRTVDGTCFPMLTGVVEGCRRLLSRSDDALFCWMPTS